MKGYLKEESVATILEEGNFISASREANADEAVLSHGEKSYNLLITGAFLGIVASMVVPQLVLTATLGGILLLWGCIAIGKDLKNFRMFIVLSSLHLLWNVYLTLSGYIPSLHLGAIVDILGYGFAIVGLLQMVLVHSVLLEEECRRVLLNGCGWIPVLEIGYVALFILGFFGGFVILIVKVAIGVFLGWYLFHISRFAS